MDAGETAGPAAAAVHGPRADPAPPPPPVLEGLNLSGALSRLGIGFDALRRMLIRFADGQAKTLADLRTAVDSGDADAAAKSAHALAGAAGNLGADTLREAAKALETAARAGERRLGDLAGRVEDLAGVVFRSIDTLRPAAQAPDIATEPGAGTAPAAAPDPAVVRRALVVLREAVEHGDLDATAGAIRALADMHAPELVRTSVEKVRALADDYQFEEAGDEIDGLLLTLKTEPQP
jgi:HPt (histidine-containing phosphotransfer) domain-containing protein